MTATGSSDVIRDWRMWALSVLRAEQSRSGETSVHRFPLPKEWGVDLYIKDETTHVSGSLKHRLARSLFFSAIIDGHIGKGSTVIEASSGSTAVSEAYFARMLGLPFISVVPAGTSPAKIALIEQYGGRCLLVENSGALSQESRRIASQVGGYFLDQFSNASLVTEWLGETGIGASIIRQLADERHPIPTWVVAGVGTGGTSAGLGRYFRRSRHATKIAMVDPDDSAYYSAWVSGSDEVHAGSRIEGIGRPRAEKSFIPSVIDAAMHVPDDESLAAMYFLRDVTGLWAGASTGTNLAGALHLVARMRRENVRGSVVMLMCDHGNRYENTYYNPDWLSEHGLEMSMHREAYVEFLAGRGEPRGSRIRFSDHPASPEPRGEEVQTSPPRTRLSDRVT